MRGCPPRVEANASSEATVSTMPTREDRLMRDRRGEVPHPAPIICQKNQSVRGSTCFLAERGERLRRSQGIDDAHAEQEHDMLLETAGTWD